MPLTDVAVKNAKPDPSRTLRLKDERGLYLEIAPAGGKWWRLRYWIKGKENRLSLGVYPDVSLKEARERRDEARQLIANGVDPSTARKNEATEQRSGTDSFQAIAEEWFAKFRHTWEDSTADTIIDRLRKDIFPYIGARPIRELTPPELLTVIRRIEARGAAETARRNLQKCGQIFRYAIATCRAERDIAADLRGSIPPPPENHFASITNPQEVGGLLRAIDDYKGSPFTRLALKLAPLVFVRPGELRHAEWSEFDTELAVWRLPAEKMKMREIHLVPLSRQSLAILDELRPLTGSSRYLFPGQRSWARPMSENTVNGALRRLGYGKDEMTGHGFRSIASTFLNELGFNRDHIERQLAHAERDEVRGAYNFAEYLADRTRMMQAWADYLDTLREGGRVIPMGHRNAG